MGADAALVNAAYRMGMASVPGDHSASFNKQYEGIIAANKAKAEMFGQVVETISGAVQTYVDVKKGREDKLDKAFTEDSPIKQKTKIFTIIRSGIFFPRRIY